MKIKHPIIFNLTIMVIFVMGVGIIGSLLSPKAKAIRDQAEQLREEAAVAYGIELDKKESIVFFKNETKMTRDDELGYFIVIKTPPNSLGDIFCEILVKFVYRSDFYGERVRDTEEYTKTFIQLREEEQEARDKALCKAMRIAILLSIIIAILDFYNKFRASLDIEE